MRHHRSRRSALAGVPGTRRGLKHGAKVVRKPKKEQISQSGPDYGLGVRQTSLNQFKLFPLRSSADGAQHINQSYKGISCPQSFSIPSEQAFDVGRRARHKAWAEAGCEGRTLTEKGTNKPVKARLWPEGEPVLKTVPLRWSAVPSLLGKSAFQTIQAGVSSLVSGPSEQPPPCRPPPHTSYTRGTVASKRCK